ncbi:MAG: hypothetical protein NTU45_01570 [Planctomycetota bacterium]|nr:hypothetical protein [Planctomycetota bacterium]
MASKKTTAGVANPANTAKSKSNPRVKPAPLSGAPRGGGAVAAVMSRLPSAELEAGFDPRRVAQEFAWEAMEARAGGEAELMLALCATASVLHRGCVDAQAMLIDHFVDQPGKRVLLFTKAVEIGVEDLVEQFGAKFLGEHMGHMWHELEARPTVRAMSALAMAHGAVGTPESHDRAIAVAEEMLRWDGEDRLGIRGPLIGWYLGRGRHDDARALLARFEDDGLLSMMWGRVLLAFITEGEEVAASLLPEVAVCNSHAIGYLSGVKKIPKGDFSLIELGGKNEAIETADSLEAAMRANPAFRKWLRAAGGGGAGGGAGAGAVAGVISPAKKPRGRSGK